MTMLATDHSVKLSRPCPFMSGLDAGLISDPITLVQVMSQPHRTQLTHASAARPHAKGTSTDYSNLDVSPMLALARLW